MCEDLLLLLKDAIIVCIVTSNLLLFLKPQKQQERMTVNLMKQHRCRLCLGNDNFQLDIFQEDHNQKQILLKIKTCLPIKVVKGDGLPSTICYKCLVQLDTTFELWKKSFNTEEILKYNLLDGRDNPCVSHYKLKNSILEEFCIDQQACDSGIFQHADSEESFLDSLEENVWKSPICQSSWSTQSNKSNPRCSLREKYDLVSDPDSSEVDEIMQRKHCFSTRQNPTNGKKLEEKEFSEVKSRIKSKLDNIRGTNKKTWQEVDATDDSTKDGRYIPKNIYLNKNLFGEQSKCKDDSGTESNENFSDQSTYQGQNDEVVRRISFPWPQCKPDHHSKRIKSSEILKHGCRVENTPVTTNFMNDPSTQEGSMNLLDLNQCPKCCKILTPSQNLLSHIQSHKD